MWEAGRERIFAGGKGGDREYLIEWGEIRVGEID